MWLDRVSIYRLGLLAVLITSTQATHAQSIYEMPEGVESRWASGEHPKGEKGRGGQADGGGGGARGSRRGAGRAGGGGRIRRERKGEADGRAAGGKARRRWRSRRAKAACWPKPQA